ncbi:thioredoxin-like protein [Lactarius tabidus]
MTVTEIESYDHFREVINCGDAVAIDFWAEWCGPCRFISPIFEEHAKKIPGVKFYKVDVDKHEQISQEAGVRAMPTFAIYKCGQKVDELVGAVPQKLEQLLLTAST